MLPFLKSPFFNNDNSLLMLAYLMFPITTTTIIKIQVAFKSEKQFNT